MNILMTSEESQEFVQLIEEAVRSMESQDAEGFKKTLTDFNGTMLMLGYEHLTHLGSALEAFFSKHVLPHWDEKATAVLSSCMEKLAKCLSRQEQNADLASELGALALDLERFPLEQEEAGTTENGSSDREAQHTDWDTPIPKAHVDNDPIRDEIDLDDPLLLKAVLHIDPSSIAFVPLAEQLCDRNHWEEAITTCRAGLFHHPSNVQGLILLGWALWETGLAEEAEEVLQQARAQYEKGAVLYKVLGKMAEQNGTREDAEKFFHFYEMIREDSVQVVAEKSTRVKCAITKSTTHPLKTTGGSTLIIKLLEKLMGRLDGKEKASKRELILLSPHERVRLKNILRNAGENAR